MHSMLALNAKNVDISGHQQKVTFAPVWATSKFTFSLLNAHVMEPTAQNVKQIAALSASLTLFNDALSRLLVGAEIS